MLTGVLLMLIMPPSNFTIALAPGSSISSDPIHVVIKNSSGQTVFDQHFLTGLPYSTSIPDNTYLTPYSVSISESVAGSLIVNVNGYDQALTSTTPVTWTGVTTPVNILIRNN